MLLESVWLLAYLAASTSSGRAEAMSPSADRSSVPPSAERAADDASASGPEEIWKLGIGNGFRCGAGHWGLSLGAGPGIRAFGGLEKHDLALAKVHLGQVVSPVVAEDTFLRGNLDVLCEVFAGGQYDPTSAYLAGCTGILRYVFATGSRVAPFLDAGFGIGATDMGEPDLSTTFEFNIQFGGGLHVVLDESTALTAEYRWIHISNAGIELPNYGTNTMMFFVGLTWFY